MLQNRKTRAAIQQEKVCDFFSDPRITRRTMQTERSHLSIQQYQQKQ